MVVREISVEFPLNQVFIRCETACVQACCGADAYDISPIHIASIVSAPGKQEVINNMRLLEEQAYAMENGFDDDASSNNIYSLTHAYGHKQHFGNFSKDEIQKLAREILAGLEFAPAINEFANNIESELKGQFR